jgi:hypothetical protein
MAGSGVSDLLNLMYFLDSREAKKRQHAQDVEGVQEKFGSVGAEVPESSKKAHGFTEEESKRSTKETAHFQAFQQQGQQELMGLSGELQSFQNMNSLLGQMADTPEKAAVAQKFGEFTKGQMLKRAQTIMQMYKMKTAGAGEEPGPLDAIMGELAGTGAVTK